MHLSDVTAGSASTPDMAVDPPLEVSRKRTKRKDATKQPEDLHSSPDPAQAVGSSSLDNVAPPVKARRRRRKDVTLSDQDASEQLVTCFFSAS